MLYWVFNHPAFAALELCDSSAHSFSIELSDVPQLSKYFIFLQCQKIGEHNNKFKVFSIQVAFYLPPFSLYSFTSVI